MRWYCHPNELYHPDIINYPGADTKDRTPGQALTKEQLKIAQGDARNSQLSLECGHYHLQTHIFHNLSQQQTL